MGHKNQYTMKLKSLTILMAALAVVFGCKNNGQESQEAEETQQKEATMEKSSPAVEAWTNLGEAPVLKIETTDGTMTVKLYAETPLHRDNFIKLASTGFYNGILFHRIINGFMVQVGDPLTKDSTMVDKFGTGGPGYTIPAEIVAGKTHKKGAIAAARRGDKVNPAKESSGSQFYIVQDAEGCNHLDGEYTVFGEVIEGLDVIDKIAAEPTGYGDRPLNRVEIINITPVKPEAQKAE